MWDSAVAIRELRLGQDEKDDHEELAIYKHIPWTELFHVLLAC